MTSIQEIQKQLLLCSKRLTELENSVEKQASEKDSFFRIPIFFSEFFLFGDGSLGRQQKTIVNGSEDVFITKIEYTLSEYNVFNSGDGSPVSAVIRASDPFFEFRWNYRLASTQSRYLSQANTIDLASRRSLGYADVGLPLVLAKPLYFAAGDAISLEVEAILNTLPVNFLNGFFLHFTLCGYRNGVMA